MPAPVIEKSDVITRIAEVFREQGYEGASLASITEATGLGKGSLYNYFPNGKREMAEAVLKNLEKWFTENIFEPLSHTDDPRAGLESMFESVESYFQSGKRICLVGAFSLNSSRDRFADEIRKYFHDWIDAIARTLQKSGVPKKKAAMLANETVAGIQGALILTKGLGKRNLFRNLIENQKERLFNAIDLKVNGEQRDPKKHSKRGR